MLSEGGVKLVKKRSLDLDKVIAKATELIGRKGLSATTLPNLAKELGVRSQSLYHYVSGRKQLLSLVGDKLNLKSDSTVSLHSLIGAVLGYVFLDVSDSFTEETSEEADQGYHELIIQLVQPKKLLQKNRKENQSA